MTEIIVRYEPEKLALKETEAKITGNTMNADRIIENTIYHGCTKIGNEPIQEGSFDLCSLTFEAIGVGETGVMLETIHVIQKNEEGDLNKLSFDVNKHLTISLSTEGGSEPSPTPISTPTPTPTTTPTPSPTYVPAPTSAMPSPTPIVVTRHIISLILLQIS